jgi:hypothetical protein
MISLSEELSQKNDRRNQTGKVKFWSKMAIGAIRAKLLLFEYY